MGRTKLDHKKDGFVSARTFKSTEDFFRKHKKLMGSGSCASIVLDALPIIYQFTISRLKEKFTREELLTILTSFNKHKVDPMYPGSSVRLEPIKNHKYKDFDINVLTEKYLRLSFADRFIVEIWAHMFWKGVTVGLVRNTTQDPEEYIK